MVRANVPERIAGNRAGAGDRPSPAPRTGLAPVAAPSALGLFPLDHQRHVQTVVAYRMFFGDWYFYRQIYRHFDLIPENSFQPLSTCIEIVRHTVTSTLQDRSTSIGIYHGQRFSRGPCFQCLSRTIDSADRSVSQLETSLSSSASGGKHQSIPPPLGAEPATANRESGLLALPFRASKWRRSDLDW